MEFITIIIDTITDILDVLGLGLGDVLDLGSSIIESSSDADATTTA